MEDNDKLKKECEGMVRIGFRNIICIKSELDGFAADHGRETIYNSTENEKKSGNIHR